MHTRPKCTLDELQIDNRESLRFIHNIHAMDFLIHKLWFVSYDSETKDSKNFMINNLSPSLRSQSLAILKKS